MLRLALTIILAIWAAPFVIGACAAMLRFAFVLLLWTAKGCPDADAEYREAQRREAAEEARYRHDAR